MRDDIISARDAWIQGGPGRSFRASFAGRGPTRSWTITLLERDRVVAVGQGGTWELALENALKPEARVC